MIVIDPSGVFREDYSLCGRKTCSGRGACVEEGAASDLAATLERLRSALRSDELGARRSAIGMLAYAVALHRAVVQDDEGDWDERSPIPVDADDALIAEAIDALVAALDGVADPPVPPLAAVLMRGLRSPTVTPCSAAATARLVRSLADRADAGPILAALDAFATAVDAGPDRQSRDTLPPGWASWPPTLRWSLIEVLTGDAARAGDIEGLAALGRTIRDEIVALTPIRPSAVRRWLRISIAAAGEADTEDLGEVALQVLDALGLHSDYPTVGAFLSALERDSVHPERGRMLRELWDYALDPRSTAVRSVLARIGERFGSVSTVEQRVAELGMHLLTSTGREGFESAATLLEEEVGWAAQAAPKRIAWLDELPSPPGRARATLEVGPTPTFVSALIRTVLLGRSLAETLAEPALATRADALLAATRDTLGRRGYVVAALDEHGSYWAVERRMVEAEHAANAGRFEEAVAQWLDSAERVHRDVMIELVEEAIVLAARPRRGEDGGIAILTAILARTCGASAGPSLETFARDLVALADCEHPEDGRLSGLCTPEGDEDGKALAALVAEIDRHSEAHFWRSAMRTRMPSFRADPAHAHGLRRDDEQVLAWMLMSSRSATDFVARLMLALLEDQHADLSLQDLRESAWFEQNSVLDPEKPVWPQIRHPGVAEVLALRDCALASYHVAVEASGGAFNLPEHLMDVNVVHRTWPDLRALALRLPQRARSRLRTRQGVREHKFALQPVVYAARSLLASAVRAGELDTAVDVLQRGHLVIGDLGHPYNYMDTVSALIAADRVTDAVQLLHTLHEEGALVDLFAVTKVVSALMRHMSSVMRAGGLMDNVEADLDAIDGLFGLLDAEKADALLYSRLIRAHRMLGRLERCEELAREARDADVADAELEVELLRTRVRLDPTEIAAAVDDARAHGAAEVADLHTVVARAMGVEGRVAEGLAWIEANAPDASARQKLFEGLVDGVATGGFWQGVAGTSNAIEAVRLLGEAMSSGSFPISRTSLANLLGAASRVAMSGSDGDRLVVAQEMTRLLAAAERGDEQLFSENALEQLMWVVKWTRSARLAVATARVADAAGTAWTASRAGRLIEALAHSDDVALAHRLLTAGLAATSDESSQVYLYNVYLSVLRGRQHEEERNRVLAEMQTRGLELDRYSRAQLGLALAADGRFGDDSRMLRSSAAEKWHELTGPLREGAKLFEPIVARLRLELRTLGRALAAGRPLETLLQRCADVAAVSRELAETAMVFQSSVSTDSDGAYSSTRYAIASDIVHELSQPTATLGLQVRELQRVLDGEDAAAATAVLDELLGTAQVLGRKVKSYRDSLADADSMAAAEDDVAIHRAFSRAVDTLDPDLRGTVRIVGTDGLLRDVKYDRELVVRGSIYLLQRAFHAMLTNSLEAMRNAGVADPTIRVEGLYHPPTIKMLEDAPFGAIQVFISDNGPGIPQEIANEVFKAGFTTRRQRGLGLGLATVASVVELHGGVVQLVDPAHARFIIGLPAANIGREMTDGEDVRGIGNAPADSWAPLERPQGSPSDVGKTATMTGTVIQVFRTSPGTDPNAQPEEESASRGFILVDGFETPIRFTTNVPGITVGVEVQLSLRQTRSGPFAEQIVVHDPAPKGQHVTGVVDWLPEDGRPFGFVFVPERGGHVVFFEDPSSGFPDVDVGDAVSALLVPGYNWARSSRGLQAIELRRT